MSPLNPVPPSDEDRLRATLARNPWDTDALQALARLAEDGNRRADALKLLARALTAQPDSEPLLARLAETAFLFALIEGKKTLIAGLSSNGRAEVAAGPFRGLVLPDTAAMSFFNALPKLLGCYEAELHPAIETILRRDYRRVVNFGCAEGYYAVGFARALPAAEVIAGDINPGCVHLCQTLAAANGVGGRVNAALFDRPADLRRALADDRPTLLFVDCEGAEIDYLDPDSVPATLACDILVEAHLFVDPTIAARLTDRYRRTHRIDRIDLGPRNPHHHPMLAALPETYRWMAMDEGRPADLCWLWMQRD